MWFSQKSPKSLCRADCIQFSKSQNGVEDVSLLVTSFLDFLGMVLGPAAAWDGRLLPAFLDGSLMCHRGCCKAHSARPTSRPWKCQGAMLLPDVSARLKHSMMLNRVLGR